MRISHTRRSVVGAATIVATMVAGVDGAYAQANRQAAGTATASIARANAAYSAQDYRTAIPAYEDALRRDASQTDLYFFLANSYDNLYIVRRQGDAVNDGYLARAIEHYQAAARLATTPAIRHLALQYLVAAYANPDKANDPASAETVLQAMIAAEPDDGTNYVVLSRLYEDAGDNAGAEQQLLIAHTRRPDDSAVDMNLAGFYQRRGDFDKVLEALQARTAREPVNPEAFYTLATFYWEKASRDTKVPAGKRAEYARAGIAAVDRALELKEDYFEALTYKNLLLRTQATLVTDPGEQQRLLHQADELRQRAETLRNQQRGAASGNQ
jgi:predicted Zn-dependent protease